MRVALHSVLRPGHEEAYDADHVTIPEALARRFSELGIRDWTIWRTGDRLFHLVDCDDFAGAMRALEDDPVNVAWQERIGVHIERFVRSSDQPEGMILPRVWSLSEQAARRAPSPPSHAE